MQFDLAGALGIADGRYVVREEGDETVLVLETLGAPAPARRRRRKPREADSDRAPGALPLTRVTVVRAAHPFSVAEDAAHWLDGLVADDAAIDGLVAEGLALLNRTLHIGSVVGEDPLPQAFSPGRVAALRIGFGSGEQVADGEWTNAVEVDTRRGAAPRRRRAEELRPQERFAAVLGGRERLDACETLLLRAHADLDAGRTREAALQLRIGLEALLAELSGAVDDPAHDEDMTALESRRDEAADAAKAAIQGDLNTAQRKAVEELTALCERVLRRRRVLRG